MRLEATATFATMAMLDSMATSIFSLSQATQSFSQFLVVVQRTEELLLKRDTTSRTQAQHPERVLCSGLVASWEACAPRPSAPSEKQPLLEENEIDEKPRFMLSGLDFTAEEGKLLAVIGKVGSGKTSLLASVMGETYIREGVLSSRGSMAYVEQEPLILSDSVRNNILFGLPLDQVRLAEVLEVCELKEDMRILQRGLDTHIGERGVNISGGQRARISLARACYSNADIFLLDDPLSAVDPQVAERLFEKCIRGFLREKAVVLVTHQLGFLSKTEEIIVLS